MKEGKILISSCLVGQPTRYDGSCLSDPSLIELVNQGLAVFVCPEQLAGLPTPRPPAEIQSGFTARDVLEGRGRVLSAANQDFTPEFIRAAHLTLEICQRHHITTAILKDKSPSCGSSVVYDGTFSGNLIEGRGVISELLSSHGIQVVSPQNLPRLLPRK